MTRKRFYLIAAVALLSVGLSSCGKDDNNGSDSNGSATVGEWVDLGLPSGLLWASHNVGTTNPEGYGDFFAWGETQPKSYYEWETYNLANGSFEQLTKYCSSASYGLNGYTDNLVTLEPADDAAAFKVGGGARIPTRADWNELKEHTTSTWTTSNGVRGRLYTAPNGKSIFLPAAGTIWGSDHHYADSYGYYWSASLDAEETYYAWCFYFNSGQEGGIDYNGRDDGMPVRAVRSAQ